MADAGSSVARHSYRSTCRGQREVSHVQRLPATVNDSVERARISKRRYYLMMRLGISRGGATDLRVEQVCYERIVHKLDQV